MTIKAFFLTFGDGVGRIIDGFPFARLANEQHLDIVHFEGMRFPDKTSEPGA